MQKFEELQGVFESKEVEVLIESSILNEFFIPLNDIESTYGITSDNNWSNADIRPNRFDRNWQNWFSRIGTWGKINILHVDPENNKRDYISKDAFIKRMGNADMLKVYGKWEVQQVKLNKMEFWNKYIGMNGKEFKEIIQIKVDLLPQLKKGLGIWQNIF